MADYQFLFPFYNYLTKNNISIGFDPNKKKCSFIYYLENNNNPNNYSIINDYDSFKELFNKHFEAYNLSHHSFYPFISDFLKSENINEENIVDYFNKSKSYLRILHTNIYDYLSFVIQDNSTYLKTIPAKGISVKSISSLHNIFNKRNINSEDQIKFFSNLPQNFLPNSNFVQDQIILKKFLNNTFNKEDIKKHCHLPHLIDNDKLNFSELDEYASFQNFFSICINNSKLNIFFNNKYNNSFIYLNSFLNKIRKIRQFEYQIISGYEYINIVVRTNNNYKREDCYQDLDKIFTFINHDPNKQITEVIIDSFCEKLIITESIQNLENKNIKLNKL